MLFRNSVSLWLASAFFSLSLAPASAGDLKFSCYETETHSLPTHLVFRGQELIEAEFEGLPWSGIPHPLHLTQEDWEGSDFTFDGEVRAYYDVPGPLMETPPPGREVSFAFSYAKAFGIRSLSIQESLIGKETLRVDISSNAVPGPDGEVSYLFDCWEAEE